MPAYDRQPISFVRGRGTQLWDEDGVEYLDAISGVAVTNLGHSHPEVSAAISDQASLLLHTSNMFGIPWQDRLGERLCMLSGMEKVFFCNSGAEANETALKLARLHANNRGFREPKVVVMSNSFHGRTFATLAATDNPVVHRGFEPLMPGFVRVPYDNIESLLSVTTETPEVIAVLVEPVQGEGGVRAASVEYMRAIRRLCNNHDWLFIVDDVQSGMGRTGTWFGFQHAGITPDVLTLAKGLGNGFPIGACLANAKAADLFTPGSHGSTFGGNPMACRVGCAVLDIMDRDKLPDRAKTLGKRMLTNLCESLANVRGISAIRGRGLMIGIEMTTNCEHLVGHALRFERLLISVTRGKTIRILPPLVSSESEIDEMTTRIVRLLTRCQVTS